MKLKNKRILLCVTGGIAAFKAAALTSKLSKAGADIHVIMTQSAKKFVGTTTFQALSRHPVYDDTFTENDATQIAHIDLADQADLVLVAPATANVIGKLANGLADDMVTTTLLATKAPVWIAPAMNVNMYEHPAVQANLKILTNFGYRLFEPGEGLLACGWVGKGRMPEPEDLYTAVVDYFSTFQDQSLMGKRILITAGATVEKIDPVRYFTNHSSGKMGYAIASEAKRRGAKVILVSGQTNIAPPEGVEFVQIQSAHDMYEAVLERFDEVDAVIKSAAVADYRPKLTYDHKIKKGKEPLVIEMERTEDILETIGEQKQHQILIGFAAETKDIERYSKEKLKKKNLDMVIANNILEKGSGFKSDTNQVTFYFSDGHSESLPIQSKTEVAGQICYELDRLFKARDSV